ncbi:MAG: class I SAM-dependent methyltransferase [Candidatus Buchananbacteria bacterium]|nr:class I SAM-dependent methyltransferase [Candidatus Buchananbacteria bacterium]
MEIITPKTFLSTLEHQRVREIISGFERWNQVALPLMGAMSQPYISIQQALVEAMCGRVGSTVLDYGCGTGAIAAMLVRSNQRPSRIVAVEPDRATLKQVPSTLSRAGFHGRVVLVNSSSMVPLPFRDGEIDAIVSGLGAIIYAGFHLNNSHCAEGKAALIECLKDCHRALKPDGYLGFSSLVPDPDFRAIKRQSILSLLKGLRLKALWLALKNVGKIEQASQFMKEFAQVGWAHYLTVSQWREALQLAGFRLVDVRCGSYAGQGLVFVAQKSA